MRAEPLRDRFERKYTRDPNGCWLWTASTNPDGYGRIRLGATKLQAHRVSWEFYCGPIPKGKDVLHRCDNPPCVNPDHLFIGTNFENQQDCIKKGRRANCLGQNNPRAILTDQQALEIKNSNERNYKLAQKFGVTPWVIWSIKREIKWKHLANAGG